VKTIKIKVAIAGVGNCASSLVQGVEYYRNSTRESDIPGLMHTIFGGYKVKDISFVAAFDVNTLKIGKDLSEAIFTEPNCCVRFANVPKNGVKVLLGPILDGVASHMKKPFKAYSQDADPVDVVEYLAKPEALMSLREPRVHIRIIPCCHC